MDDNRDLTPAEVEALRRLGDPWTPPDGLAERTLAALRSRGLLRSRATHGRRSRPLAVALPAAAALVAFLIGFSLGADRSRPRSEPSPTTETAMPGTDRSTKTATPDTDRTRETAMPVTDRYALLLFKNAEYRPAPTADEQKDRVREYGAWLRAKGESGRFVSGEKLTEDGRWCRVRDGRVEIVDPVSDGARGALAGYFIVGAASYDEAVDIARDCPHLRYGGTIEVRRLES